MVLEKRDRSDPDSEIHLPLNSQVGPSIIKKAKPESVSHVYLNKLPDAETYIKSYMHRDNLSFVIVTKTDFIITCSIDGNIKFWKKKEKGIEFVKNYKAHLKPVIKLAQTDDGLYLASISSDQTMKIFDISNFDMINIINLDFTPSSVCWVKNKETSAWQIFVGHSESGLISRFSMEGSLVGEDINIHSCTVVLLAYNNKYDLLLSADESGKFEYWEMKEDKASLLPSDLPWNYKTETDLYIFQKTKSIPFCLDFSHDFESFATISTDNQIRVFDFLSAKIKTSIDESIQSVKIIDGIDEMEFGRRLAVERELQRNYDIFKSSNALFDESGYFLFYPTIFGVKIFDLSSKKVVRLVGLPEPHRFISIALWQQQSKLKSRNIDTAASENPLLHSNFNDPTLFCTAYRQNRFYLFSNKSDSSGEDMDRDVFNEKPSLEDQKLAVTANETVTAESAIIRTTKGDIHIQLYPSIAPKTVENFVGLSLKNYYNNVIFHRVIKDFMIQTGDPLGDGTGGESLWGSEFKDEFSPILTHDKPFTVSMANAGPNTNGSQFFITTVPTPWLDNKHTVFGRVTSGMDVVLAIEKARKDKNDKPFEDISIINVEVPSLN
ncbi:Peptidyl-prolyl cis-trans isomerase cyp15 [Smittium mucronatum]|uniref:peptidylprolyl isomerase n=1 Tax=Smittium mucronatum TaxID=133383 RepID=A0A1R0H8Z0_9FUNG|nr:Peptidyl-prolyl cis-trans isomerase cyp15 [Smittium mucronatum]